MEKHETVNNLSHVLRMGKLSESEFKKLREIVDDQLNSKMMS